MYQFGTGHKNTNQRDFLIDEKLKNILLMNMR
jgi:hypothetical protein